MAAAQHLNRNIGGYVAGNLVISLICGAVTTASLYALDVPYSLALGVFMAVFDLIPLVGATIGSFVVIASAFIFVDVRAGVIMFVIMMVYQQVENHVLQPLVYGRTVQIPSLTVLDRGALRRRGARADRCAARDPHRRHDPDGRWARSSRNGPSA